MTDKRLQACEDMAYRQQPVDVIEARLVRYFDMTQEEASAYCEANAQAFLNARLDGQGTLRDIAWSLANGDNTWGKLNGTHMMGLMAMLKHHCGHGEPFDASSLRELLEQGKLQVKSKKGLRAVSGGRK